MAPSDPYRMPRLDTPRSGVIGCRGYQGTFPLGNHGCGISVYEWLGRDMNIPEYIVTAPESDEANGARANSPQEEVHRPTGAKLTVG